MQLKHINIKILEVLNSGGVVILPTDTLYGMHVRAENKAAVESLFSLRKRSPLKPFIILISNLNDLNLFNIKISRKHKNFLQKIWPNSVSVILPCPIKKFEYLHRGTNTLAFRIPKNDLLIQIIDRVGPLVSTTVNFEGKVPAKNIKEAKKYFGDKVDFYVDAGEINSPPSTLIEIKNDKINVIRKGAIKIPAIN